MRRLVIARKIPSSETGVIQKTLDPQSLKGERGAILGLWTANMPGEYVELVFRPDGQFRLSRCSNNAVSQDYGLYTVDMPARTLVYDSRFVPVQTQGLDFYGDTLTIFGGNGSPSTYTVNLGQADPAIKASMAADAQEAQVDAQWLPRAPIDSKDPNAVPIVVGNIPADPNPGVIFSDPTVFQKYQLYRRLFPPSSTSMRMATFEACLSSIRGSGTSFPPAGCWYALLIIALVSSIPSPWRRPLTIGEPIASSQSLRKRTFSISTPTTPSIWRPTWASRLR